MISQVVYEVVVLFDPADPGKNNESFALYNEKGRAELAAEALQRGGKSIEVRERRVV
jgi:hypothetical protein